MVEKTLVSYQPHFWRIIMSNNTPNYKDNLYFGTQGKIDFYESQNLMLRQRVKELEKRNFELNQMLGDEHRECEKTVEKLNLLGELAIRDLNQTLSKLCRLAKRERECRRHILTRLGIDDTYNKK